MKHQKIKNKIKHQVFFICGLLFISGLSVLNAADKKTTYSEDESYFITTTMLNTFSTKTSSDTLLNESFEGEVIGWTYIDNDNDGFHWSIFSEQAPNDTLAHTGLKGAGIRYNEVANDDWFLTPPFYIPPGSTTTFSFWARSHSTDYLEDFNVKLSTSGTAMTDFSATLGEVRSVPFGWTQYSYDISNFAGETITLAIQCVSLNKWYLWTDDYLLVSESESEPISAFWQNTAPTGFTNDAYRIAVDSQDRMFVGINGNGILLSTDHGQNWINNVPVTSSIFDLVVHNNDYLFAGVNNGIYRSMDSGQNWENVTIPDIVSGIYSIAIDDNNRMIMGAGAAIYLSDNYGTTMQKLTAANGLSENTIYVSMAINSLGHIFAGTNGAHIYRSIDNGNNWERLTNGLSDAQVWTLAIDSEDRIFAGTGNGICVSTDNGSSWIPVTSTNSDFDMNDMLINSDDHIFTTNYLGGVWRSTDHGMNWENIDDPAPGIVSWGLGMDSQSFLYCGGGNGQVYRSSEATVMTGTTIRTEPVTNLTPTSVTLNSTINPNSQPTDVFFEYGTTSSYGQQIVASPSPINGSFDVAVNANLSGLSENTEYHYRVVATSSAGTIYGADQSFMTLDEISSKNFTDNFDNNTINPFFWTKVEGVNGVSVDETQSEIKIYGTSNNTNWNKSGLRSKTFIDQDVEISVDIKKTPNAINSNTMSGLRLNCDQDDSYFDVSYSDYYPGYIVSYRDPDYNQIGFIPAFGDEQTNFHTLKIIYNAASQTAQGYIDNQLIAEIIGTTFSGKNKYAQFHHASNVTGNLNVDVHFDNFTIDYFSQLLPLPTNGLITNNTSNAVTLNGIVNPNNYSTDIVFEWGLTSNYGNQTVAEQSPVNNDMNNDVSANLVGLTENTLYHYRIYSANSAGVAVSADQSFTTLSNTEAPVAITSLPEQITVNSVELKGAVNPNGLETSVSFVIGLTTSYSQQISASPSPINGTSEVSVSANINGLSENTEYHYRVVATSAAGTSYGSDRTFTTLSNYPETYILSTSVSFPNYTDASDFDASDYKMIGLPGSPNVLAGDILDGIQNEDWQLYYDNGKTIDYFVEYDGSTDFVFNVGTAFWFIHKGSLSVSKSVSTANLNDNNEVLLYLHSGWNIITNPFVTPIPWSDIQTINDMSWLLWDFNGSFIQTNSLAAYKGYYIFNTDNRKSIRIPYQNSNLSKTISNNENHTLWEANILLNNGDYSDKSTRLGVSSNASIDLDNYDQRKPRGIGKLPTVNFNRPNWDDQFSSFASDIRPEFDVNEVWDFEINYLKNSPASLSLDGIDDIPSNLDIYLIDKKNFNFINLRTENIYDFIPQSETMTFSIAVGENQDIENYLENLVPEQFHLGSNYPNPFNSTTMIPLNIPEDMHITLEVYNVLGEKISTLYQGQISAGKRIFSWSGYSKTGEPVPSGIYFTRVSTGTGIHSFSKMALIK